MFGKDAPFLAKLLRRKSLRLLLVNGIGVLTELRRIVASGESAEEVARAKDAQNPARVQVAVGARLEPVSKDSPMDDVETFVEVIELRRDCEFQRLDFHALVTDHLLKVVVA